MIKKTDTRPLMLVACLTTSVLLFCAIILMVGIGCGLSRSQIGQNRWARVRHLAKKIYVLRNRFRYFIISSLSKKESTMDWFYSIVHAYLLLRSILTFDLLIIFAEMMTALEKLKSNFTITNINNRIKLDSKGNKTILTNLVVEGPSIIRPRKYSWSGWWDNQTIKLIAEVCIIFGLFCP